MNEYLTNVCFIMLANQQKTFQNSAYSLECSTAFNLAILPIVASMNQNGEDLRKDSVLLFTAFPTRHALFERLQSRNHQSNCPVS